MNDKSYKDTIDQCINELTLLMSERDQLDTKRNMLTERILRLRRAVSAVSELAGVEYEDIKQEYPHLFPDTLPADIGMTDAVRKILQSKDSFFSPVEVRANLDAFGYDVEKYKNILASIHTILKRLAEAGEVETSTVEDATVYRWKKGHKVIRQGIAPGNTRDPKPAKDPFAFYPRAKKK